jgi:hypothetical protein
LIPKYSCQEKRAGKATAMKRTDQEEQRDHSYWEQILKKAVKNTEAFDQKAVEMIETCDKKETGMTETCD